MNIIKLLVSVGIFCSFLPACAGEVTFKEEVTYTQCEGPDKYSLETYECTEKGCEGVAEHLCRDGCVRTYRYAEICPCSIVAGEPGCN